MRSKNRLKSIILVMMCIIYTMLELQLNVKEAFAGVDYACENVSASYAPAISAYKKAASTGKTITNGRKIVAVTPGSYAPTSEKVKYNNSHSSSSKSNNSNNSNNNNKKSSSSKGNSTSGGTNGSQSTGGNTGSISFTVTYTPIHTGWRVYVVDREGKAITNSVDLLFGADASLDFLDARGLDTRVGGTQTPVIPGEGLRMANDVAPGIPKPSSGGLIQYLGKKSKSGKYEVQALDVVAGAFGAGVADQISSGTEVYLIEFEPLCWQQVGDTDFVFYGTYYNWLRFYKEAGITETKYAKQIYNMLPKSATDSLDGSNSVEEFKAKHPDLYHYRDEVLGINGLTNTEFNSLKGGAKIDQNNCGINIGYSSGRGKGYGIESIMITPTQSTCNEPPTVPPADNPSPGPGGPAPEKPHVSPEESKGKWKIHKTYRTVTYENGVIKTETNDGQFLDPSTTNTIKVEDEEEYNGYKLVAWGTQKQTFTPNFKTGQWEAQCFSGGPVVQKGKGESTVTMPEVNYANEEIIYLLLERTNLKPSAQNVDYVIPESMVTRDITLRYTDSKEFKGYFTANSKQNAISTETTVREKGSGRPILQGKKFQWKLDGIEAEDITYCSSKTWDSNANNGAGDWDKKYDTATQSLRFDTKPSLVLGIQNTKFPSAPESIFKKFGEFMGGVKSKLATISLSTGNSQKKHELTTPAFGSEITTEIPSQITEDNGATGAKANGANYQKKDTDEWTYKVVIHRGKEKLVVPEWKKGYDTVVDNINYIKGNKPNAIINENKQDFIVPVSYTFADASLKKSVKVSSKIDGKTDWGGDFIDADDDTHTASYNGDSFNLKLTSGAVNADTKIGVMVYHGMQGVQQDAQYADTSGSATNTAAKIHTLHTEDDKPSHVAGGDMSFWASGYATDTGNQSEAMDITFYPYVQMNYEKLYKNNYESDAQALNPQIVGGPTDLSIPLKYQNSTSGVQGQTYIMGLYSRGLEAYNFAEVLWGTPASEAHPNLKLQSDQWSTHATVTNDLNTLNFNQVGGQPKTVLPGGAIIKVGVDPDVGDRKVKLVSFQVMPSNKAQNAAAGVSTVYGGGGEPLGGLEQVKATGGGTYTDSAEAVPAEFKAKHEAYVKSFIEIFENKTLEHWENRKAQDSPFDGVKVYNDPAPSSLGNLETADDNTASAESKYYFKIDASESDLGFRYDRSGESSQESDFDVRVVGASDANEHEILPYTKTGTYVAWADVAGNVHQVFNANGCSGSAAAIDQRTKAFTNLSRAVERKTGFDNTLAGKKNNGTAHWYSEAFDGVTVIVQETDLIVSLKYPTQRSQVYDPKLTAPNLGGQATLFNGGKDLTNVQKLDHYRSAAFRTNPYDDPDPEASTGKNRVGTMDCDVFTTGLEWFYVSRRFYIPSATTQDLR